MSRPSWIGQTLGGRYKIEEIVGQGGMSAVYKAMDPNLQRVVAVKLVHPHLADDPKFVDRFEEEARAVAQLRHPNIVQVYDFDNSDDVYYMVQEFVPGETLQQRLRRLDQSGRKMELTDVVKYTLDILNAMGYAHQRGMIHRDIKPANIMLDVMGRAILMDFGIVKIMGGQKHTATGAVVGTAMYMCPEMIRGEQPDERSDIYSLGVTMFEMINGRPPYEAESAMTLMMMHLNDPLPNLQSLRPDVPGDLVAVIEKALAKDRSERYRSTAEMAAALGRVQDRLRSGVPFDATLVEEDTGSVRPPEAPGAGIEPEDEQPAKPIADEQARKAAGAAAAAAAAGAAASQAGKQAQPEESVHSADRAGQAAPYDSTPEGTLVEPPVDTGPQSSRPLAGAAPVEGKLGVGSPPATGSGGAAAQGAGPGAPAGAAGAGGIQGGGPPSTPAGSAGAQPAGGRLNWLLYIGGGVLVIAVVLVLGLLLGSQLGGGDEPAVGLVPEGTQQAAETGELPPAEAATATPTFTPEPTATETLPPTETPTITPTPTLEALPTRTPPPGQMFVRINGIELRGDGYYEVAYETFEYTETLPGDHVHFFWNTVTEANAGSPGSGPWILYGGPRPFDDYAASQRPADAGAMCALVANPNHSIQPGSGTCWPLPDVPVVTALEATQCLSDPSGSYDVEAEVPKWENMLVKGTLESGGWFYVANPDDKSTACWVPEGGLFKSGDWSGVPNVNP